MKRRAAVGLAIVLVVASVACWVGFSRCASSAEAAAARYEQGEVAVSGGRLRVVSQVAVRRLADRVTYRISWNRDGAPFDRLIVVRHMSQLGGLASGWSVVDAGSARGQARS